MNTTILSTAFGRSKYLRKSLNTLVCQPLSDLGCNILIINDGVKDESEDIVREYADTGVPIEYLFTGERNAAGSVVRVPGYALNIGIRRSFSDIILLTNSDMYHIGDTLPPIIEVVQNDPWALGTLGNVYDDDGQLIHCLSQEIPPSQEELSTIIARLKNREEKFLDQAPRADSRMPYFLAVRREHLINIGGYDEDFLGHACEDTDLLDRLCDYGCHYVFTSVEAIHLFHGIRAHRRLTSKAGYRQNLNLLQRRHGRCYRNVGRSWGRKDADVSIRASICIATYDKSKLLDKTLDSIYKQCPPFKFEVIVVDDGSPGITTYEICARYGVQYHRINRDPGFQSPCTARNMAYRHAKGDVIIAQSDEVVHINPDTIERLVTDLTPGHMLFAYTFAYNRAGELRWEYVGPKKRSRAYFFLGSVFREDLYAVGGNDEDFAVGPAGEDRWFSHCLMHGRGLIPVYSHDIVGHHLYHLPRSSPKMEKPSLELCKQKFASAISGKIPWCSSGGPWPFNGQPSTIGIPPRIGINSIVVCVEYDDFLAITLPRNCKHFDRTLIVTVWNDEGTQRVAMENGCECITSEAFYKGDAAFNKGAAMEEGFDVLGRVGWICVWDADTVMPESMQLDGLKEDCLYVPGRHILETPTEYQHYLGKTICKEAKWKELRVPTRPNEFNGYFQLFHARAITPPWYSVDSGHAGRCDSDFAAKYPKQNLKRLPFNVLHLGPEGIAELGTDQVATRVGWNWRGRVSPRIDTGEVPAKAKERRAEIEQMVRQGSV